MDHANTLITTIVSGIVLAFIFGLIAQRLKFSPLVGYLMAGVVAGPHTPGFTADGALAQQMAEIGIILLMFGVGLNFSPAELKRVRGLVIPGALCEMTLVTLLGFCFGHLAGFDKVESFVFGLCLSVASTVVMLRGLEERKATDTPEGRTAIGWLIVEDIVMVLALVFLPALLGSDADSSFSAIVLTVLVTIGKIALFIVLMLVVGTRVLPGLLVFIAKRKSRELFTLGVPAVALGIAYAAAEWFGASFALGAFLAGLILSESEISQRAAEQSLPLREAFAVLFFVSVGMLFDPNVLVEEPLLVLSIMLTIMVGKALMAGIVILALRRPLEMALAIAANLAQIGEFSFILAGMGMTLGVLSQKAYTLILAGALLSIAFNPFYFRFLKRLGKSIRARPRLNAFFVRLERPVLP